MYKVLEYVSDNQMKVQPISYSSNSYEESIINNTSSSVKSVLDTWYKNSLVKYTSYLADEIFCNDRSIASGSGYLLSTRTYYSSYDRLVNKKSPTLSCVNNNDKFNLLNIDAKLDYPVALITADEVAMAGGVYNMANTNYYLYNGQYFWTLSPSRYLYHNSSAYVWYLSNSGSIFSWDQVFTNISIRPVINLRADVQITKGDGTTLNPYVIQS